MSELPPAVDVDRAPGVSRRTLLQTAAWSAPVVVLAAAVPAAAASDPPIGIDPGLITLDVYWRLLGVSHGFTITNESSEVVTALVMFTASATPTTVGGGESSAVANLIAATDVDGLYSESFTGEASASTTPDTYQALWADDIAYAAPTATRSGQMTFTLGPGASFSFWQSALLPLNSRTITAAVTSLAVAGGPLTPITGGRTASFTV